MVALTTEQINVIEDLLKYFNLCIKMGMVITIKYSDAQKYFNLLTEFPKVQQNVHWLWKWFMWNIDYRNPVCLISTYDAKRYYRALKIELNQIKKKGVN